MKIRNLETGEERTIGADDFIPPGWIVVYDVTVAEPFPKENGLGFILGLAIGFILGNTFKRSQ